jgi:isopentenyldiphosphate isomerase
MRSYTIPLVNESGRRIGYGNRWLTHRTRDGPDGPILGQKHVGITIVCIDDDARIILQHRRHKIFDKVWSLSGDTHPRKYEGQRVETLSQAAKRCAKEDLGITVKRWIQTLTVSYSAQDPRDPRYCENELLYLLAGKCDGQPHINRRNVYELQSADLEQIVEASRADTKKEPIDQRYGPWVHALFALPSKRVKAAFRKIR